jgi:hypothetical protein
MNAVTLGQRDTSETGTTNTVEATSKFSGLERGLAAIRADGSQQ